MTGWAEEILEKKTLNPDYLNGFNEPCDKSNKNGTKWKKKAAFFRQIVWYMDIDLTVSWCFIVAVIRDADT